MKPKLVLILSILIFSLIFSIFWQLQSNNANNTQLSKPKMTKSTAQNSPSNIDSAVFAAGCFWCVEAQFLQLNGVEKIVSGYMGGTKENPTYPEVCTGTTGHAEVVKVYYNPQIITYDELLAAFFYAHDPTQYNRQGEDIGTQYRSEIFYNTQEECDKAKYYINKLNEEKVYERPIVTNVTAASVFYPAEDYHQNYYNLNPNQGYCQLVIKPKLEKFKRVFGKDK